MKTERPICKGTYADQWKPMSLCLPLPLFVHIEQSSHFILVIGPATWDAISLSGENLINQVARTGNAIEISGKTSRQPKITTYVFYPRILFRDPFYFQQK